MLTEDQIFKLIEHREHERVELKEWKTQVSFDGGEQWNNRKCLLGYCVAIGNEGGGYLVIGVANNGHPVGTGAVLGGDTAHRVYQKTGQKLYIQECRLKGERVLVIHIPSRTPGELLKYANAPLMRVGDSLEAMSDVEMKKVLLENDADWSADLCDSALDTFDPLAVSFLRATLGVKESAALEQVLSDINLLRQGKLTHAAMLLLGTEEYLREYMGDTEICFEYRNNADDIQHVERIDYRKPFVIAASEIWEKIKSRQQVHHIHQGLFRIEIPAFNEVVIREALFNAVCHRDYRRLGSIFIRQSPQYVEITNPGGFLNGITPETIVDAQPVTRNRLLTETFQRVFKGVERSGQGANKIFQITIEEGKGAPVYGRSDAYSVVLRVPGLVQDEAFIAYLRAASMARQYMFTTHDILLLEKIRGGDVHGVTRSSVGHLVQMGVIELHGRTRGAQYVLSSIYYASVGKLGVRTRRIGLSRDARKELILQHIRTNGTGAMSEFVQVFPDLKRKDITNMLAEMKTDGKIQKIGKKGPAARWGLRIALE
jgi:ATP-dependent DNA helicase RecG